MAFIPRLNDSGMMNNPYWYSGNPFYLSGYGLANCTCFAWGRAWECAVQNGATNPRPDIYNNLCPNFGNAWTWESDTLWNTGQEPALGAIAVYDTTDKYGNVVGNPGHVAVLEQKISDDVWVMSESNYGYYEDGQWHDRVYFRTRTTTRSSGWRYFDEMGYNLYIKFKCFIYNPFAGDTPTPPEPPTPTGGKKKIWLSKRIWLRKRGLVWL